MISSELPEVIGMSDRILVMRDGTIAGELPAGPDRGRRSCSWPTGEQEWRGAPHDRRSAPRARAPVRLAGLRASRRPSQSPRPIYGVLVVVFVIAWLDRRRWPAAAS